MSAYSMVPPGATTYRAGMVNVQLGSPLKAARSAPQPSKGTQFVAGLPARAESAHDTERNNAVALTDYLAAH